MRLSSLKGNYLARLPTRQAQAHYTTRVARGELFGTEEAPI
jgi:hypothetical protein